MSRGKSKKHSANRVNSASKNPAPKNSLPDQEVLETYEIETPILLSDDEDEPAPEPVPEAEPEQEIRKPFFGREKKNREGTPQLIQKNIHIDKASLRYIFLALAVLILFAWSLVNINTVGNLWNRLISLLAPFLIGGCIAFLVNIILTPVEKLWDLIWKKNTSKLPKKLKRPVCLTLSALLMFGVLFAVVFMMIPGLKESGEIFINNIPAYTKMATKYWDKVVELAARYKIELPEYAMDSDALIAKIREFVAERGSGILSVTIDATSSVVNGIVNVLLGFVFALYLLAMKESVGRNMKQMICAVLPKKISERLLEIIALSHRTFTKFVSGQLVEAFIIGILCFIGMLIFRFPYAGAVSVLIGFTALIPVFGAWIGAGVSALLIFMVDPIKALWFLVFLIILQQVETNLIYPRVVGKSVGLPGILVLMAVTIGGTGFGVFGMLFAVPVCAVLYSLYQEFLKKRRQK